MVTALFRDSDTARVRGLWQWDYGQVLRIQGLQLPTAVEIQFSLDETGGEAQPRVGTTKDGVTDVISTHTPLAGRDRYILCYQRSHPPNLVGRTFFLKFSLSFLHISLHFSGEPDRFFQITTSSP